MSNFVTLEEAAKKLGVSTDQLIEMRSRGDIFGYRDGASWKFKPEEIERVAGEMMGEVLDEDPAGSSILSLDPDSANSAAASGLSGLGSNNSGLVISENSDISLQVDPQSSDLRLVANSDLALGEPVSGGSGTGSGISQVDESGLKLAKSDDDDDDIDLAIEDSDEILSDAVSGSSGSLSSGSGNNVTKSPAAAGSDISLGSDALSGLNIASGSGNSAKSGIIRGDSDPNIKAGGSSGHGSDLNLSADLELDDELVLGSGSDLALSADSGINLMSPADSGISLEDEPLDLAASGISGLDLALEGSDASGSNPSGSAVGSGVEFQQDEDFQLSPSGGLEQDDDSGSQVIELEDSSEFGDAAVALPAADGFADMGQDSAFESTDEFAEMAPTAGAAGAVMFAPEVPYSTGQVLLLLIPVLLLAFSGLLVSDVVRNMWMWSENETAYSLTSGITKMLVELKAK
jgi:Helix-turn-helix domain